MLVKEADGTKNMTAVAGGPSRPCKVEIEAADPAPHGPGVPERPHVRLVRGRFEATVGLPDDASSPTRFIRGAFAGTFIDMPR